MASVLVAGGATGIGRAVVQAFRKRGDSVLLADRNLAAAREVAEEVAPGPVRVLECDFATVDGPGAAVRAAVEFGGGLDVVFYNAGVLLAAPLAEWTVAQWDLSMQVNLRAPFLVGQAAAPHLAKSELGRLIFTSSTGALRGHAGMPAYHASKAGLVNLARAFADELSPQGIRVNCICPGWVDTPFNDAFWSHQTSPAEALKELEARIPLRRQAQPEDIAGLVMFLASPESGYITGESIVIDGGYSAV
ncbi:SDR family oxidoreductase [Streptosporangium sp. NPDC051022]|uniref:SDR family NAD(P)-dependent oxidoreductase n=1 Tax=Streptosporangium sp. NPDC051022 TaxID=3155752 RepID=UPI0034430BEF